MPLLRKNSNSTKTFLRISALLAAAFSFVAIPAFAQQAQIEALAEQAAQVLQESHAKRVVVLDFSGPGLKVTQLGRDLADQFSEALSKSGGEFVVTDRAQFLQGLSTADPPMTTSSDLNPEPVAGMTHANIEVLGHLESDGNHVSVAVEIRRVKNSKALGKFDGTFDESKEIDAELAKMLSKFDYPDSDAIGYTAPTCQQCPIPRYSGAAFKAHVEGMVKLSTVVEAGGRADHIVVEKRLGAGLDESAVKAVQSWRFEPAVGPDGKPAAVRMLIEVDFHLSSGPG